MSTVGVTYIRMLVHAFLAVRAVREELALFLGVEVRASLVCLSAIREVLALHLLLVICISTFLPLEMRRVLLVIGLKPDVVSMGAQIDHPASFLRDPDFVIGF